MSESKAADIIFALLTNIELKAMAERYLESGEIIVRVKVNYL